MGDEIFERLEGAAERPVAPPDARFVDRLESDLRVQHAGREMGGAGRWRYGWGFALAGLLALVGFFGVARLSDGDEGVPLEVTNEGVIDDSAGGGGDGDSDDVAPDGGSGGSEVVAGSTPTPTPTPSPTPDAGRGPAIEVTVEPDPDGDPDAASDARPAATPTTPPADPRPTSPALDPAPTTDVAPTPTPVTDRPAPTATPVLTANPTPVPTRPAPTPRPLPSPTPLPTATPTPTPPPTPTPRPDPSPFTLVCEVRSVADAVGVACEWTPPGDVDVDRYVVLRSLNGAPRETVGSRRADQPPTFIDRNVASGDRAVYVVRGLSADRVVAMSNVSPVQLPG